jgi:L-asparaginase
MIPIKFGSSDGLFNLGSALAFAQNTTAWDLYSDEWPLFLTGDNVRKNKETGVFEEVKVNKHILNKIH